MAELSLEEAAEGGTWVRVNMQRRGPPIEISLGELYEDLRSRPSSDAQIDRLVELGWDDAESIACLRQEGFILMALS